MSIELLAQEINNLKGKVTILTGAGISTPSGIPDFRSSEGLWSKVDPMQVARLSIFKTQPENFWEFHRFRFSGFSDIQPNAAHQVVSWLEDQGFINGLITQNIDGLHQKAGNQNLVEVHGNARKYNCFDCKKSFEENQLEALYDERQVPLCDQCTGVIKPGTVLFEEMLPEGTLEHSYDWCNESDMLICIGTSLQVHPVAGLAGLAADQGKKLVIITKSKTPYDKQAWIKLDGEVDQVLLELQESIQTLA